MPRNTLKSFPTAMLRRGMASFHPSSRTGAQAPSSGDDSGDDGRWRRAEPVTPRVAPVRVTEPELVPAWS
jgi:hypothetical protein